MAGGGEPVRAEVDTPRGTARIILARPPLNILDIATLRLLGGKLVEIVRSSGCPLVVIESGVDGIFSAGADVADHVPERVPAMLRVFHDAARFMRRMPAVSIAVVDGPALGGGFELALCCDFIVAGDGAIFGFPEMGVGCFPPIAAAVLPGRIGPGRAADLILTGRRIGAAEAREWGIASRCAGPGGCEEELGRLLEELRAKSPSVLKLAAGLLREEAGLGFEASLARRERAYLEDLMKLEDSREGVRAFLERRPPVWTGD